MSTNDERLLALATTAEVLRLRAAPRTAMYICRRDGFILWAQGAFQELFGLDAGALVGHNAWEIFPAKEDLDQGAKASARLSQGDMTVWLLLKKADGSKDWFRTTCLNREGGVVLAFQREDTPGLRHFHWAP